MSAPISVDKEPRLYEKAKGFVCNSAVAINVNSRVINTGSAVGKVIPIPGMILELCQITIDDMISDTKKTVITTALFARYVSIRYIEVMIGITAPPMFSSRNSLSTLCMIIGIGKNFMKSIKGLKGT